MSILAICGLLIILPAACGVAYQLAGIARDAQRVLPPGQLFAVGDKRFHVNRSGHGMPIVVLESGLAASSVSWTKVQPAVSTFAHVMSYDRAGFGWSDRRRNPRRPVILAKELHELLEAAKLSPPYILVGHSFGGLIVRAFIQQYPQEVSGLVLVDALHPHEWLNPNHEQRRTMVGGILFSRVGAFLAAIGVVRFCLQRLSGGRSTAPRAVLRTFGNSAVSVVSRVVGEVTKLPKEVLPAVRSHWSRPKSFLTMANYIAGLRASSKEMSGTGLPSDLPLVVLSAEKASAERNEEQKDLAQLCANVEHAIIPDCGHWVHLDRPDVVVEAIRRVVEISQRRSQFQSV
jgi:pimeloyl-ACP methyl ester carboxylesterase